MTSGPQVPDPQGLDEQLCFALYSAARAATGAYRDLLAPLGLTYTQYVTLLALWEDDGATVSALGRRLHLDSGTLSPLLRRLQAGGLVDRRRDPDDERRVTVHLTPRGWALQPQVAAVQQRLHGGLPMTPHELATLRDLALRFAAAAGPAPSVTACGGPDGPTDTTAPTETTPTEGAAL